MKLTFANTNHTTNRPKKEVTCDEPQDGASPDASARSAPLTTPAMSLSQLAATITAFLDDAEDQLGPTPPQLTATQKRRTAKPRKGANRILLSVAPIVQQHGLDSPSLSTDDMVSRLDDAEALRPLQSRLQKMLKRVDDELFNAQGEAWEMGLQFYALMKRRARTDGNLATSLEQLKPIFVYRHPLVKKDRPTKIQTRAKARLASALSLAKKYDVAPNQESQAGAAPPPTGETDERT